MPCIRSEGNIEMWRSGRTLLLLALQITAGVPVRSAMQSLNAGDTFVAAQISKADQAEIVDLLENNSVDWDRGRVSQLRARRISLTPLRKDGLAVQSTASVDCGATGNCFFLIFQQQDKGWHIVLSETAIDRFAITKQKHHGLYDVELSANDSSETSTRSVMIFDGTAYHFSRCFHVEDSTGRSSSVPCPGEGTE